MKDKIKLWLKDLLKKTPLISGMAYAPIKVRKDAGREFAYMWAASMLPIFWGVIIYILTHKDSCHISTIIFSLKENFDAGEIFIFSCAALAPAAFLMSKYNKDKNYFPNHDSFDWALKIIFLGSVIIFALFRAKAIAENELMEYSGMLIYAATILVWYLSVVYNHDDFISFAQTMHEDENRVANSLQNFTPPEK
jgi:hypothetical protein